MPRIYKTYLQELSDICRDYFWVFCHPNNTIWNLDDTDEAKVEKPRAPGGMTGGVEFEAMTYMVNLNWRNDAYTRLNNTFDRLRTSGLSMRLPPRQNTSTCQRSTNSPLTACTLTSSSLASTASSWYAEYSPF